MQIDYHFWPVLPTEDAAAFEPLVALLAEVLESTPASVATDLRYRQGQQPVQAWLASVNGQLVGCKLGHERQPGHYYSWLGGVLPGYRRLGVAAALMEQQHAWCQEHNYRRIRTQTFNKWRAMLLLNLRHGFDIVGTIQAARGLTIVLEKGLAQEAMPPPVLAS
ncbi:GNAT family N-acetyltransferase [Hymenobacter tenuis]